MCNKCNEKSNNCGYEEVNAKCVIYKGVCLDNLEVCSGDNLEYIIKIINDLIAEILFDNAKGTTLSNIGEGVGIVHNENSIAKDYEIRSVKKGDESIDVYLDGDTIKVSVNKDWFQENLPVIPEPEEFVLTSNKNTILINDKNIEVNPNMFFSANNEELVITEEPDGRLKFDIKVENLIKSVGSGTPLFTGLDMTDGKNKIRTLSFESDTLNIQGRANDAEGVVITIDTYPEDPNMKYFYVNENYTGVIEDGSMGRPYKTFSGAINAFIGSGSRVFPEFYDKGKIVLLSNVSTTTEFNLNGVELDLGGYVLYYDATDPFIDTATLIQSSQKDSSGKLVNEIFFDIKNGTIISLFDGTLMNIKHYHNGTNSFQKDVSVKLNNVTLRDDSHTKNITMFNKVTRFDGEDVLVYSNNIYYSDTKPIGTPLVIIEDINFTGEGAVTMNNVKMYSSLRNILELKNSSANIYNATIAPRFEYFLVNSQNNSGDYRYTPKTGLSAIKMTNSYLKIISGVADIGAEPIIDNKNVIMFDDFFNMTHDSTNIGNRFSPVINQLILEDFIGPTMAVNNMLKYSGEQNTAKFDGADLDDLTSIDSVDGAVKKVSGTSIISFKMEKSFIKDVLQTTPVNIVASDTIVNKYPYNSLPAFGSDSEAKSAGLIVGNIYFSTKDGALTKVQS